MGVGNLESGGLVGSLGVSEKGMVYLNGLDAFGHIFCSSARGGPGGLCGAVSNAESGS